MKRFRTENNVEKNLVYTGDGSRRALNKALDVLLEESEEKQHPLRDLAPPILEDEESVDIVTPQR